MHYFVFFASLSLFAALVASERLWPARRAQRAEWLNNAVAFAMMFLSHIVLLAIWPAAETALVNRLGGGIIDLRTIPLAFGAAIYLVAMDLGEYLFHRAQHAIPAMWVMHSLHHSDRGLNVATSQRHFWLEPAIKTVSIWLVVALLFKANATILLIYSAISVYHLATHANLRVGFGRLSWLLNSPQYHRLHHSTDPAHFNTNFASLLPVFDVISGAYRRPCADEYPPTGLDDAQATAPLDLIFWPLRGRLRRTPAPISIEA